MPEPLSERRLRSTGPSQTCRSSPCCRANSATNRSSSSDSAPRSLWLTCATDSTIPNSPRNSSSKQSNATESAPPETATATRSPARSSSCFRIVLSSLAASSCILEMVPQSVSSTQFPVTTQQARQGLLGTEY